MKVILVMSAVLLCISCAHVHPFKSKELRRIDWQNEEWEEAVEYAVNYSVKQKCRDFYSLAGRFRPNYTFEEKMINAGEYYGDGHEIVYRDRRILFHESGHALDRLAPKDCVSEVKSTALERVRVLEKEIRRLRLNRR